MVWNRQPQPSTAVQAGRPKIMIGVPYEVKITMYWGMRMLAPLLYVPLAWADKAHSMVRGVPLPVARDQIVEAALADPSITHILFVDSDNICVTPPNPNDALKMLYDCNQPIVSGLYRAKQREGFNYAMWMDAKLDKPGFVPIQSYTGNWLQVDVVGMGFCLAPETIIMTDDGVKEIQNIIIGDSVLTASSYKKVEAVSQRQYNGRLIDIKPHLFKTPLRLTPEHEVLLVKQQYAGLISRNSLLNENGLHTWVKAGEIEIGDLLIYPRQLKEKDLQLLDLTHYVDGLEVDGEYVYFKHGLSPKDGHLIKTRRYIDVNEEFCYMLGLYLAEGSARDSRLTFAFNIAETLLQEKTLAYFSKLSSAQPYIRRRQPTHCCELTICSKALAELFKVIAGSGASEKKLANFFMELPLNKQLALLSGLFIGDGSIVENGYGKNPRMTYVTVSRTLAFQVRDLLLRLGIAPRMDIRPPGNSYIKTAKRTYLSHCKEAYEIEVSGSDGYLLARYMKGDKIHIPLTTSRRKGGNAYWSFLDDKYVYFPVYTVSQTDYSGPVFNLQIQDVRHYTTMAGIVHNCLVRREVYEKLPKPWYPWPTPAPSEDFNFCISARKHGFAINVFTEVQLRHLGELAVNPDGTVTVLEV
jgi:intein/homing endonuclease